MKQEDRLEIVMKILEFFTRLWHERVGDEIGSFDLIRLLQRDENATNMVDDPMNYISNFIVLVVGGNDTTRNSTSGGVLFLNYFPEEFAQVSADQFLVRSMVSEITRFQTPLSHKRRSYREILNAMGITLRRVPKSSVGIVQRT